MSKVAVPIGSIRGGVLFTPVDTDLYGDSEMIAIPDKLGVPITPDRLAICPTKVEQGIKKYPRSTKVYITNTAQQHTRPKITTIGALYSGVICFLYSNENPRLVKIKSTAATVSKSGLMTPTVVDSENKVIDPRELCQILYQPEGVNLKTLHELFIDDLFFIKDLRKTVNLGEAWRVSSTSYKGGKTVIAAVRYNLTDNKDENGVEFAFDDTLVVMKLSHTASKYQNPIVTPTHTYSKWSEPEIVYVDFLIEKPIGDKKVDTEPPVPVVCAC